MKTEVMMAVLLLMAGCSAKRESAVTADYESESGFALRGVAEKTVRSLSEMKVEIEIEKPLLTLKAAPATTVIEGDKLTIREKSSGGQTVKMSVDAEGAAVTGTEGAVSERSKNHFESSGWKRLLAVTLVAMYIIVYTSRKKIQVK